MIDRIIISNFATIEDMEIEFHKGLNVITGETGAGKSVLAEAISLALGSRADTAYVRSGCEKAIVQMVAEQNNNEVVITRELSAEGKNLCRIDGKVVTLTELSELCSKIADIHGQYDHQSLLDTANHIKLVDNYEKEAIIPTRRKVADLFEEFISVSKRLKEEQADLQATLKHKEMMEFEIKDINKANLTSGEDDRLSERAQVMKNQESIYQGLSEAYDIVSAQDGSACDMLNKSQVPLREIAKFSRDAANLENDLSDLYYRLEDVSGKIRDTKDKMVFNSDELDEINDRLSYINEIKRKYNGTIDEVLEYADRLRKKVFQFADQESSIDGLRIEKSRIEEMLRDETERLSSMRRNFALELEEKIQKELEKLNFNNAQFSINFNKLPNFTADGVDKIEFLLSANKGEALKPLSKIVSGGEMSRIVLAFKKIISEYDGIPTMIFDEIDSGISGETASIVGKVMNEIADNHQLITITHLPQIASYGDHNYRIEKTSDENRTYTTITHLSDREKVAEIARLLSGINISDITMQNAQEMIELSKS